MLHFRELFEYDLPMKIIIVGKDHAQSRTYSDSGANLLAMLGGLLLTFMAIGGGFTYLFLSLSHEQVLTQEGVKNWQQVIDSQQQDLELVRQGTQHQVDAVMLRLAELQGRMTRLDALGERLTAKADLNDGEFDFSEAPAQGGPHEASVAEADHRVTLLDAIEALADQIEDREQQLDMLDALIANRTIHDDSLVAGLPVKKGWLSSRYGRRTDPFTGKPSWHKGVDFAGKRGSEVVSVAAGVVVSSETRHGYGLLVEVNHGNGFLTRYAHNEASEVKVGDIVSRGQVIARMGSSGRSTGPHVHFEVLKDGRHQDPARYLYRKAE